MITIMNSKQSETELPLRSRPRATQWINPRLAVLLLGGMLVGCGGPIRTDIINGSEPRVPYDAILQLFGGGCFPENLRVAGHNPPPCSAGPKLSAYFSKISDQQDLSDFLARNGMACLQSGLSVECNAERYYDSKPSVWGQPEYPVTRNSYRIKVIFQKRSGPYSESEIKTIVRRTSKPV
jgi:hypothetical protein